jgi:hypothetical protein
VARAENTDVPAGAAMLPEIPQELGVHPLLVSTLGAIVFLQGSDQTIVDAAAAEEQLERIAASLQCLQGNDLDRIREDLQVLAAYAKDEGWPKTAQEFFSTFLNEFGIQRSSKK